ncbi:MAG: hypothetical protein A2504_04445 [Bdellovibrionales bacterium RIFOXYD12_FULL_39_22]|nr:MAG: hypothetical protein A2385_07380 [Bdellovibrionales bacterium RIFOXYB1_FULL_39_21]OFZ42082.1 MAG: hypothetical protein A2485_09350 [Bdellovibrionales bacterium RIFOXYC12_FULL_39_17]OFZ50798.1 MAG: hypothetical protein A2404_06300 [Bdellovibrionales bacterium RIFOXYC1_FULL_39_130]OFZ73460.1 MAG: hypothetical protein A2451_10100 [Bdellovibrionales bacterium RIFOXYC2_FULL_39_8]OFZ78021.1 MAG: hypothetical protein A2560_01470 [Bdellovibrionales bacterium RIFOXYD1_FULL_39_84]OFZ93543.1 MAG:
MNKKFIKKFVFALLLSSFSVLAHAEIVQLSGQIVDQSYKLQRAVEDMRYSPQGNRRTARAATVALLEMANRMLGELDGGYNPGPGPAPIPPTPPYPYPGPNPGPGPYHPPMLRVCAQDSVDQMQAAFTKIKAFAYSTSGLDLTSSGAADFATTWNDRYPCVVADEYIADFQKIKTFAYSTRGLDMNTNGAIEYASRNIEKLCDNFDLEGEFRKHYDFAYSTSGLDMTSSNAIEYARGKIEPRAFSCRNFNQFVLTRN